MREKLIFHRKEKSAGETRRFFLQAKVLNQRTVSDRAMPDPPTAKIESLLFRPLRTHSPVEKELALVSVVFWFIRARFLHTQVLRLLV